MKLEDQDEIKQLENVVDFMQPDKYVNTGFELSTKRDIQNDPEIVHSHKRFHTNQNGNLVFVSDKV